MGSNYYGEANIGSISSSSSSSSSRKGKKGSSDKPKQPQRGLGVAQLEKIRLHSQLGSNYLHNPSYHHPSRFNHLQEEMTPQTPYYSSSSSFYSSSTSPSSYGYGVMMGMPEINRTNIRYGDNQSSSIARWNPSNNNGMGTQHFMETKPFFEPIVEGSSQKQNKIMDWNGGQISESSGSEEIDLELRLSR